MAQLIGQGINTTMYVNSILRNHNQLGRGRVIVLREDEYNMPDFTRLADFKPLVLDLCRQVNAAKIHNVAIIVSEPGSFGDPRENPANQGILINQTPNSLILVLANEASFVLEKNRFTPSAGDLIWSNEDVLIENNSLNKSICLVIDFEEFVL